MESDKRLSDPEKKPNAKDEPNDSDLLRDQLMTTG